MKVKVRKKVIWADYPTELFTPFPNRDGGPLEILGSPDLAIRIPATGRSCLEVQVEIIGACSYCCGVLW